MQDGHHLRPVGHDQLCGGGWRRGADVGREIGQRHVHLVAHARHDGNRMRPDGPYDAFVVERPQILQRAAAAGQDDHLRGVLRPTFRATLCVPAGQPFERRHDAGGRPLALDLTR